MLYKKSNKTWVNFRKNWQNQVHVLIYVLQTFLLGWVDLQHSRWLKVWSIVFKNFTTQFRENNNRSQHLHMTGSKAFYIATTTISVEFEVSFYSKSHSSQPASDRLLRAAMSLYFVLPCLIHPSPYSDIQLHLPVIVALPSVLHTLVTRELQLVYHYHEWNTSTYDQYIVLQFTLEAYLYHKARFFASPS